MCTFARMNDDFSFNSNINGSMDASLQRERYMERPADEAQPRQVFSQAQNAQQAVLPAGICPNCGARMDEGADFCESCHHYARPDVCSFCGTQLDPDEAFCHECGNPRKGIACPVCHTINEFAFCKQCGAALTVEAQQLLEEVKQSPEYKMLEEKIYQLEALKNVMPIKDDRDKARAEAGERLRMTVLRLLAEDKGEDPLTIEEKPIKQKTAGEVAMEKQQILSALSAMLDKMALKPMASPVKARNYAMATKPIGVRMAWVCNYKHAMHSSPCGCAKPQLGGKWVILEKNSISQIKDDL